MSASINYNVKGNVLKWLFLLFLCISSVLQAQTNSSSPKGAKKQDSKEAEANIEKLNKENEISIKEIENSGLSEEEKKKKLNELGLGDSRTLGNQICFAPKTIATQSLEKFPDMFGEEAKAYLANVLVLNPAIALDFNMYPETTQNERIQEVSKSYTLDERSIMLWVLPNLQFMKKYSNASDFLLMQNVHLFFQYKPELYNFIPIDMRKMLNSEKGINQIIQTQQKYLSNL